MLETAELLASAQRGGKYSPAVKERQAETALSPAPHPLFCFRSSLDRRTHAHRTHLNVPAKTVWRLFTSAKAGNSCKSMFRADAGSS